MTTGIANKIGLTGSLSSVIIFIAEIYINGRKAAPQLEKVYHNE
ncbi:hypothetical protein MPTP_0598 [Melissococcus plutonius ATCC 35311]|uniref:Uncharacterized protein n=1 Tax=Melissococcus plutonius (strain ATCC 35311 / DSM 29964 / CIP 104052 / LMG 20360 / NCIMB 702443) TaxID=940190 RepID=F3Y988_MELPT|nr:hypothetical protein MPTP_0598 [Melissococcus plutonius ATCC 35311]